MIRKLLTNIRQKPKPVRDKIALGIASGFTAVIFVVWIFQMSIGTDALNENLNGEESDLITQFIDDVKGQVASVTDSVKEVAPNEAAYSGTSTGEEGGNPASYGNTAATQSATTTNTDVYTYSTTTHTFSTTSVTASPTAPKAREVRIVTTSDASTSPTVVPNE